MGRKHKKRKHKLNKRRRLSPPQPAAQPTQPQPLVLSALKPTPKEKQLDDQENLAPLTYPPELLKKDILKTMLITFFILLFQISLYWYDKSFGLTTLPAKLASLTHLF
ncbi:MAG: hypothetical protein GXP43_00605 [bacterium]|nr:hypothetical protein [bacterium]